MSTIENNGMFESFSQRVAFTYRRMLAENKPVEMAEVSTVAQLELHAFFETLYDAMCAAPGDFGLPSGPDQYVLEGHSRGGQDKTQVKKVLDKPRKLIDDAIQFLCEAGLQGRVDGDRLALEPGSPCLDFARKKGGKAWLSGAERAGLKLDAAGLANVRFPRSLQALQALAQACATCPDALMGRFFFARCDLRALRHDFSLDIAGLYQAYEPQDQARAAELHAYYIGRGYQALPEAGRLFNWVVKYQGKKSVKATPLFQLGFDDRRQHAMHADIKCASAQRVAPLVEKASQALQDDFARRANQCGGCSWCANQKTLGPTEYIYQGQVRKICWYVNSNINQLGADTIDLVKEYTLMHESLA